MSKFVPFLRSVAIWQVKLTGHSLLSLIQQVNGCSGKMGKAVIKAADSAGVNIVPSSFGSAAEAGQRVEVCGKEITVHGPTDREKVLSSLFEKHPELIVVDYTVPSAVNGNSKFSHFYHRHNYILDLLNYA